MRQVRRFSAIAVLLGLLVATPAAAQQWSFEDAGVPIAYVDNGPAQFQFACRGGDLAMGYWVRAPHKTVAGAASMSVAIMPDPGTGDGLASNASFAQELPLIHSDGSSVIVRGPVARQWARIAQRASTRIRLAFVRSNAHGKLEPFDSHAFDAKGSSAAIKQVLDRCG